MCIFTGRAPRKQHWGLERKDAIAAYKTLSLSEDGKFCSPWQKTEWDTKTLTAPHMGGHDSGIYAMKSIAGVQAQFTGARHRVIVKVALYGDVAEYGHRDYGGRGGYMHAGYRAQHAEIVEVLTPSASETKHFWRNTFYGFGKTDLRRLLPELRRRYEGVKFPTYAQLGLR